MLVLTLLLALTQEVPAARTAAELADAAAADAAYAAGEAASDENFVPVSRSFDQREEDVRRAADVLAGVGADPCRTLVAVHNDLEALDTHLVVSALAVGWAAEDGQGSSSEALNARAGRLGSTAEQLALTRGKLLYALTALCAGGD